MVSLFNVLSYALGGLGSGAATGSKRGRELAFGKKQKYGQVETRLPEQIDWIRNVLQGGGLESSPIFQQGMKGVQQQLSGPTQQFYESIESPLMRQLQQQTLPGIQERYGSMGTGAGLGSSSALNQALARALENYQTNIASQRSQFLQNQMNQGVSNALSYGQAPFNIGLAASGQQTFQPTYTPATQGLVQALAPAALQMAAGPMAGMQGLRMGGYQVG